MGGDDDTTNLFAFLEINVTLPNGRQRQYILDAEDAPNFVLGRKSEILIEDNQVSQVHAMVFFDSETGWKIKDLQSTNGTYVNGVKIKSTVPLNEGDVVKVGLSTINVGELSLRGAGAEQRTTAMAAWQSPSKHLYVRDVIIKIDEEQKEKDVQEIVESDYFQKLQERMDRLRAGTRR